MPHVLPFPFIQQQFPSFQPRLYHHPRPTNRRAHLLNLNGVLVALAVIGTGAPCAQFSIFFSLPILIVSLYT